MMTREEAKEKFLLTDEEVDRTFEVIIESLIYNKEPSKRPVCIIIGGQSGAGKTALINATSQISDERNFVVIDNDYFRSFHPRLDEIKALCPELYTPATDQIGLGLTSRVINFMGTHKYNILLHQTTKNNRIFDDAAQFFRSQGYIVGARILAVPYVESMMSMVERCTVFEDLNQCRIVAKKDHDAAYEGMLNSLLYMEENNKVDFFEIVTRGKRISQHDLVYAGQDMSRIKATKKVMSNCRGICLDEYKNGYANVQEALEQTRRLEELKTLEHLEERVLDAEHRLNIFEEEGFNTAELREQVNTIKAVMNNLSKDCKER